MINLEMNQNKIQVTSSDIVYRGKWLAVRKDEIVKPDGVRGTYEVVERRDIVAVIPKEQQFFYMVEQYRHAVQARSLEFPGGFIDESETPLQAAKRELQEEVGARAKHLTFLNTMWIVSGYSTQKVHIFLADSLTHTKQKLDVTESDLKVKKFTLKELEKMITTGIIKNGPTIAALGIYNMLHRDS